MLTERIRRLRHHNRRAYGAPRIHAELADAGIRVGRKRVARLMRQAGLAAATAAAAAATTGGPGRGPGAGPGRPGVHRDRTEPALGGRRDLRADRGGLALSGLSCTDVFSRRSSAGPWPPTARPAWSSTPSPWRSANRGGRWPASSTTATAAANTPHMTSSGRCAATARWRRWAASPTASTTPWPRAFFATLECELFGPSRSRRFTTRREAKLAVFDYLEVFYNRRRRHSALGQIAPATFEARHADHLGGLAA